MCRFGYINGILGLAGMHKCQNIEGGGNTDGRRRGLGERMGLLHNTIKED
jgi:hypothetical protein